jgi:glycosyltransferase involved in cell wall biosynthesis
MRILFLYMFPLYGNGSGSFLRELSAQLVKRGHDVAIVAPDKRKLPEVKHYIVTPPQNGVFVGHPEWPKAKQFGDMNGRELGEIYATYLKTSLHAVTDFKPDVVHSFHTAFLPEIARMIRYLFGIKYVMTTHGSDLSYLAKDRRFLPSIADANRTARIITAVSPFTRQWYLRIFGQSLKNKTTTIVGGVNLEPFKRDPEQIERVNKKYNLTGKKVVLYTGRINKNKGVVYLVRAAAQINGTVVIVGDGPEKKNIEAEIKRRNIKNVVMTGYINAEEDRMFHAFYERADVFVSPSVWDEALGLTILEAMAAHCPVVATRKGGILAIINDKQNGFLIRARNSKEIVAYVNKLLDDEQLRIKMAENAYQTVTEKFAWEKIAQRFEKIYEDIRKKDKETVPIPLDDFLKKLFTVK